MNNSIHDLYALEKLSSGKTFIHRLHPTAKLAATAIYIIAVVSFDGYSFGRLVPYVFYPTLLMALSETPYGALLKRFLVALPFCLFAGIANALSNRAAAFAIGGMTISYGVVSLFTIMLRTYLCVMAVLALVAVTPLSALTDAMRRLKMPFVFVAVFEMIYRYAGVLFEEAHTMGIAYSLRGGGAKGIKIRDMGSFVGQLLLCSIDRSERVYNAMKCRGYALRDLPANSRKPMRGDYAFFAAAALFCLFFRFVDVNSLIYKIAGGTWRC